MLDAMARKALGNRQIDPALMAKLFDFLIDILNDCKKKNSPEDIEAVTRRATPDGFTARVAKRRLRRKIGRAKFRELGNGWADSLLAEVQASSEGTIADIVEDMV